MQRALIACVAVGAFAPTIGVFLVQKRLSLIGDGIGHVAFAGVGAGLLAGWAPLWTALAFAVGGSLGIEWFRARRRTSGDVALAILFYSGIALGVVLISLGGGLSADVLTYLFGQPLTVRAGRGVGDRRARARHRRRGRGAAPGDVLGRHRRGMVAGRRAARRRAERAARRADRRGRGRRDADRRHPARRRDDGAAGRERADARALVPRIARDLGRDRRRGVGRRARRCRGVAGTAPGGTIVLVAAGVFVVVAVASRTVSRVGMGDAEADV